MPSVSSVCGCVCVCVCMCVCVALFDDPSDKYDAGKLLVVPTHAAGAIDVQVCEWLYVSLSLLRHRRAGVQPVLGLRCCSVSQWVAVCCSVL